MRPLHARLMVLGASSLVLGALACSHDLTTGPAATARPSYAKGGVGKGVVRSFKGKNGTFEIDHDRSTITEKTQGKAVTVDAKSLAVLEKGFDNIDAMDRKIAKMNENAGFKGAMERASHSNVHLRLVLDPGGPRSSMLAPVASPTARFGETFGSVSATTTGLTTSAALNQDCTEIELQIYEGTRVYEELRQEYDDLVNSYYTLGWGFGPSGMWEFSGARFASQLALWAAKSDVLAYKMTIQRTTLDYLAIEYQLLGCWNQYQGAGGAASQPTGGCKQVWSQLQRKDGNGVWVTYWEGYMSVCDGSGDGEI